MLNTQLDDSTTLRLTQKTDYPWDGHVKITVDVSAPSEFAMMMRIPGWLDEARLKVNGQTVSGPVQSGTYHELRRVWSRGDTVELELPMPAQLIEADPRVEETRHQVAVKRGPLVYCLESVDLPDGVGLSDVVIPQHIKLSPRFDAECLSGVTVLEGAADVVRQVDWSNQLYRKLSPAKPRKARIKLIPYFAWSNRGVTDMTVWMPLRY